MCMFMNIEKKRSFFFLIYITHFSEYKYIKMCMFVNIKKKKEFFLIYIIHFVEYKYIKKLLFIQPSQNFFI